MTEMNNACIFLEKEIPVRECLIRKIAAKKRATRGVEGFDPCLHCDKVQTKGETVVAKIDICVDCKEDITIISHGRCYQCLKKARAAGVVPPPMSWAERERLGLKKGDPVPVATKPAPTPPNPPAIPEPLPGKPERMKPPTMTPGDLVDLASIEAQMLVMNDELMQGSAKLQQLGQLLRTISEKCFEARQIIRKHIPK